MGRRRTGLSPSPSGLAITLFLNGHGRPPLRLTADLSWIYKSALGLILAELKDFLLSLSLPTSPGWFLASFYPVDQSSLKIVRLRCRMLPSHRVESSICSPTPRGTHFLSTPSSTDQPNVLSLA
ncbi:hypothetical protein N7540_011464 [Penicillium herquei]|nr:hypothetical protein N7540_011464 [Penicillium herquei]